MINTSLYPIIKHAFHSICFLHLRWWSQDFWSINKPHSRSFGATRGGPHQGPVQRRHVFFKAFNHHLLSIRKANHIFLHINCHGLDFGFCAKTFPISGLRDVRTLECQAYNLPYKLDRDTQSLPTKGPVKMLRLDVVEKTGQKRKKHTLKPSTALFLKVPSNR